MVWKLIVFITQGPWKSDCWGIPGMLHNLQKGSVGWVSLWLQGSFYTWKLKHWLFRGNRPDQRTRLPYFYRVECCKEKSLKQQGCHRIDKKSKIPDNVFDFFFFQYFLKSSALQLCLCLTTQRLVALQYIVCISHNLCLSFMVLFLEFTISVARIGCLMSWLNPPGMEEEPNVPPAAQGWGGGTWGALLLSWEGTPPVSRSPVWGFFFQ